MFNDPASVLMGLRMMRRGGGPVYLLRDEFTTDASAPLTSPRTCEPGPGTLVFVQTDGEYSTSSGALLFPQQTTPVWNDQGFYSSPFSRQAGLMFAGKVTFSVSNTNGLMMFLSKSASISYENSSSSQYIYAAYGKVFCDVNGSIDTYSLANSTPYIYIIVARSIGEFHIVNESGAYYLTWVSATGNDATLRHAISNKNLAGSIDYVRIASLAGPWDTDYGIATARTASASAGNTLTGTADAIIEATWTAATGETWELDVRRTDDSNRWCVRGSQSGSTIKLIQIQDGVETERSSASQTWTNATAYRLVVVQDTQTIRTFVANVAKNSYTSASFNQTATGVKTSHAVANLIAWPRTLSGAALAELQRYTA